MLSYSQVILSSRRIIFIMTKKNAPTMKDVAREAGVALGTVSKVINGIPVSEEYRNRVLAAIETLHYEVNTYARGLKTQRTNLIALIIPNTVNPFFSAFTDYIEGALYQRGLRLLLCCADGIPEKEIDYLNLATQNKVDGIIALTYSDIGKYIADDIPIVVFDRFFENHVIPRVASDNFAGGCMAVEKLLELGCRHPVYIRFHSVFPGESDKRMDGYLYACKKSRFTNANILCCLSKLNNSIFIIVGNSNPENTLSANQYQNQLPSIEIVGINETKQLPHVEKPKEFIEQIRILFSEEE